MFPLLNYWREAIIAVLAITISVMTLMYKNLQLDNAKTLSELQQYKQALSYQNEQIETNKADYVRNMADANKTKEIVRTEYKTRTEKIYIFGEHNATCNEAMSYLNHYDFN